MKMHCTKLHRYGTMCQGISHYSKVCYSMYIVTWEHLLITYHGLDSVCVTRHVLEPSSASVLSSITLTASVGEELLNADLPSPTLPRKVGDIYTHLQKFCLTDGVLTYHRLDRAFGGVHTLVKDGMLLRYMWNNSICEEVMLVCTAS